VLLTGSVVSRETRGPVSSHESSWATLPNQRETGFDVSQVAVGVVQGMLQKTANVIPVVTNREASGPSGSTWVVGKISEQGCLACQIRAHLVRVSVLVGCDRRFGQIVAEERERGFVQRQCLLDPKRRVVP
jgi:hypothetical protein